LVSNPSEAKSENLKACMQWSQYDPMCNVAT
jgi:hypothetical protein